MQNEGPLLFSRRFMLASTMGSASALLITTPCTTFAQTGPQSASSQGTNSASRGIGPDLQWLEANGTILRYQLVGSDNPTVVLIHEMTSGLETWDEILPEVARGRRVLRYDLRGVGRSERIRGTITYEDHAKDLLALLDALQLTRPVVLVGSALGAAVGVQFAATYPDRVKSFVALSPAISLVPRPEFLSIVNKIQEIGLRAYMDNWTEDIYPRSIRTNKERWARYRGMELSCDQESIIALIRTLAAAGFKDLLPKVKCPALVVHTSLWSRPEAEIRKLSELMPAGQFTVAEAGHYSALESPEAIVPVLMRFLDQNSG